MKKGIIITILTGLLVIYISSCYNNKSDIPSLPKVSFLRDVVPVVTSGACGCHNNVNANSASNNAIAFSLPDTVINGQIVRRPKSDAIVARVDTIAQWANDKIPHPGGGNVFLTENQKILFRNWKEQGQPYDGGEIVCDVTGSIKYSTHIVPIYNGTCKSAGCHGGRGPVLDYNKMVADKNTLLTMMNSGGSSGHPGGVIGLSSCVTNTFKTWIVQGQPQ